jgi:prophage tail gpP-like protein
MREVALVVNAREYGAWKDIRVTRSIESISGSFSMSVSERWDGRRKPWPIVEGDECTVRLGDQPIITGYVDTRSMSLSANDHTFSVTGRDRASDLIDCSAVLKAWEFNGGDVIEFAQQVAEPFGLQVKLQAGLEVPTKPRKIVINPGESPFDVIDRICRLAGLFPVSDGEGNLVLTLAGGTAASTPLIEGKNILDASVQYDASACYRRYIVIGQQQGSDQLSGTAAADVRAEAFDMNAKRAARVLMIRAEGGVAIKQAQDRANWEASIRRARALQVNVRVQGWDQADGSLWPLNAFVTLDAPFLGLRGRMLISEITYALSDGAGTTTELTLRPPGAFEAQPEIPENEGDVVQGLDQ